MCKLADLIIFTTLMYNLGMEESMHRNELLYIYLLFPVFFFHVNNSIRQLLFVIWHGNSKLNITKRFAVTDWSDYKKDSLMQVTITTC